MTKKEILCKYIKIKKRRSKKLPLYFVGIARFELATSCSQSRRDNRTTLYPESGGENTLFYECLYAFNVFFSKQAIVTEPTPPGTGVRALHFFTTSSNLTSPQIL